MYSYLMKTNKTVCPYCRTDFDSLYFQKYDSEDRSKDISYNTIGDLLTALKLVSIPITCQNKEVVTHLLKCYEPFCGKCSKRYPNVTSYKKHMAKRHKKIICTLCHDSELLPHQIQFYKSIQELKKHQEEVVKEDKRHPSCKFCSMVFKDVAAYHKHSKEQHHFCTVCHKKSKKVEIFGNIFSYRKHVDEAHSSEEDLALLDIDSLNRQVMSRNFMLKKPGQQFGSFKDARVLQLISAGNDFNIIN